MSTTTVLGVEGEERNDLNKEESRQIRRRSLRLLGSLLHPLRTRLVLTAIVVVISTAPMTPVIRYATPAAATGSQFWLFSAVMPLSMPNAMSAGPAT